MTAANEHELSDLEGDEREGEEDVTEVEEPVAVPKAAPAEPVAEKPAKLKSTVEKKVKLQCPYVADRGQYEGMPCPHAGKADDPHHFCAKHINTIFAKRKRGEIPPKAAPAEKAAPAPKAGKKPSVKEFVESGPEGSETFDFDELMKYMHINEQIKREQAKRQHAPAEEEDEVVPPKPVEKKKAAAKVAKPKAVAEEPKKVEEPPKKVDEVPKKVEPEPLWRSFGIA